MKKDITRREFIRETAGSLVVVSGISTFALLINLGNQYRYRPLWHQSQKLVGMKGGEDAFLVRPPGARGEGDFLAKCIKCYLCVEACPLQAIKIAGREKGWASDTPYIIPEVTGCDLCLSREKMFCNQICPTDALEKIPLDKEFIYKKLVMGQPQNMGVAILDKRICYAWTKVSLCWACYEICPYKGVAVTTGHADAPTLNTPLIHPNRCVGCSLCVEVCPVPQKAIKIVSQGETALIREAIGGTAPREEKREAAFEVGKTESRPPSDTVETGGVVEGHERPPKERGDEWQPSISPKDVLKF